MKRPLFSRIPFFLVALLLATFPGILRAELIKYVVGFEQYADAFEADAAEHGSNSGWSWNNTTDRMYSGTMPEGMHVHEYTNGSNYAVGYIDVDGVKFSHLYAQSDWGGMFYWEGTGISNVRDTTYAGFQNEMASSTGTGAGGSDVYGVVYSGGLYNNEAFLPFFEFPEGAMLSGMMIDTTVYLLDSMTNGDQFAEAMVDDGYMRLHIYGYDADGNEIGEVTFDLGNDEYFVTDWTWLDLSDLANAAKIEFDFTSHDMFGPWLNYPMYFAFDDVTYYLDDGNGVHATPEPASLLIFGTGLVGLGALRRKRKKA